MLEHKSMISIALNSERPHTIILNGFDRSGSSAISKSLSQHPDIELFMQPFNSGPVRRKMYQIWDDTVAAEEDIKFFEGLETGILHREYIHSHWFEQHSTSKEFIPGRLHVVKTTLNHLLIPWCQTRFPNIHQWAIWRDPWQILSSLIRNDFIGDWYADGFEQITVTVKNNEGLSLFAEFLPRISHPHSQAAFLIAVRSFVLFTNVNSNRVIFYNEFKKNPSGACALFFEMYGLMPISIDSKDDLNIIGTYDQVRSDSRELIDASAEEVISSIFAMLTKSLELLFPTKKLIENR